MQNPSTIKLKLTSLTKSYLLFCLYCSKNRLICTTTIIAIFFFVQLRVENIMYTRKLNCNYNIEISTGNKKSGSILSRKKYKRKIESLHKHNIIN